jgi:hypothetical protein
MSQDIFEFWSEVAPGERVHPRDRYAMQRVEHGFDLRCLPACYGGPLRTAPVVLLYLSPGLKQEDIDEADTPEGQARYVARRTGHQPLRGPQEHVAAWQWWSQRTKQFGPWEQLRDKVAVFNISGYHSARFMHPHVLAALPSCRVSIGWAQDVLFPQAERGKRVVICMRSARYWGLGTAARYGQSLFVPPVNRGGHMLQSTIRDDVIAAVRAALR